MHRAARRVLIAALFVAAIALRGPPSGLAGTTGAIDGTVVDRESHQPVAGARVTAASPSQSATTTADAMGRFSFVSLAPDRYDVSVESTSQRESASVRGVPVQADQTLTVLVEQTRKFAVIGSVGSRSASELVKPGTTADMYSINPVAQDKASTVGGGGNLNSAWSAIATVPGVFVAPNQSGYIGSAPTLSIRGGDFDQIGYELDGIPVNNAFDNYPSGALSSLGQQELEVYTGAAPANAEATGISGYINQVIRTGSTPANRTATFALGSPVLYNKASFEAGGANAAKTFSYYLGAGAYVQGFRYYDQYDGAALQSRWGEPLAPCSSAGTAPSCGSGFGPGVDFTNGGRTSAAYVLGPYAYGNVAAVQVRDAILNLHAGLPRKDGNRDDVQLLFDNNFIGTALYNSTNDLGGAAYADAIGLGVPFYVDGYSFVQQRSGTLLPVNYTGGGVTPYFFPHSPGGRGFGQNCDIQHLSVADGCIEPARRDAFNNDQSVVKLQYQHNFGTRAFLRVYGYTYYSDWLQTGPQSSLANYVGVVPAEYDLSTHTRGFSVRYTNQMGPRHLVSALASYTTATSVRDNNAQMFDAVPFARLDLQAVGVLVDQNWRTDGLCYDRGGLVTSCYNGNGSDFNPAAGYFTFAQAAQGTVPAAAGKRCGAGQCRYLVINEGPYGSYNTVVPKFGAVSLSDQWKPFDRLSLNFGLRFDRFRFQGADTTNSPARQFLYAAWNREFPNNPQFNPTRQVNTYDELQPRLGATYAIAPSTVVRASYGRYAQAPDSAYQQYDYLEPNAPSRLAGFAAFGIGNTPAHRIRPPVSDNFDVSLERQLRGDSAVKLTPFLRKTRDQIQPFFLDPKTGLASGLNVGRQTSRGFELELDKGDFTRNGIAARLSFTYTNSYINYVKEPNGQSVVDGLNAVIAQYDAFTRAGGGAPCYRPSAGGLPGAADPACAAGSIANPYYLAPTQPPIDPAANFPTFDFLPGNVGLGGYSTYGAPYVATLIAQYKHGRLAITPAVQFLAGMRYGVPLSTGGIYPNLCGAGLASSTTSDPRYPYGALGGGPYDVTTCTDPGGTPIADQRSAPATLTIPDPYTGRFDGIGAFVAPAHLLLHAQLTYEVNKRVTLVASFANIINRCWGGTAVPFAVGRACSYGATAGAGTGPAPIGNAFNPGWAIQPMLQSPYYPLFAGYPFNTYIEARVKL